MLVNFIKKVITKRRIQMTEISQQAIENEIELIQKEKSYLEDLIAKKREKSKSVLGSGLQMLQEEIESHEKRITQINSLLSTLAEQGKIAGSKLLEIKAGELTAKLNVLDIDLHEKLREKLLLLESIAEIEKSIQEICEKERHGLVDQLRQLGKKVSDFPFPEVNINLFCFDITSNFLNLIGPLSFKDYIVDVDASIKKIKERI